MKYIIGSFFIIFSINFGFSQSVKLEFVDSTNVEKMEAGTFTYFNASVQKELVIEGKTTIFIDFALMDIPMDYDSIVAHINTDKIVLSQLTPFILNDVDESLSFDVVSYKNGKAQAFKTGGNEKIAFKIVHKERPVIVRDEIVFGLLALVLALIFFTAHKKSKFWSKFYMIVPALLLCYVVPAILVLTGLISAEYSNLYVVARDYLLPAALILMTLGIDFKAIVNLGSKALIMFITGTVGVIIGGPIAILIYSWIDPSVVGGEGAEAAWRGMATIAGSWIGGGANQNAMYETYAYAPQLYGKMIVVDIVVANMWMAFLLWAASRADKFDRWLKADSSAIEDLKKRVIDYEKSIAKQPTLTDYLMILGIAFGVVGVAHFGGEIVGGFFSEHYPDSPFASSFLWLVVIATTGGLLLSTTKLRKYEGAGASKIGSVFIYILVATIGMKMELAEAIKEPQLIVVGLIWMVFHAGFMFLVAKLIKAPFFFLAVGSKANIGGAASAPIVAAAFHPSLASVGAILAVLGYALGTYGAIVCAELMRMVAP
jgi:uncharacterized membrane protein